MADLLNSVSSDETQPLETQPTPRWPAIVALLAVVSISLALPEGLTFGPRPLLPCLVALLLLPTIWAHRRGAHDWSQFFGYAVNGVQTFALVYSVGALVFSLPTHRESAIELMRAAFGLWISNVLVFALWYWRLDAGGPHGRDARVGHESGAFQFPQMAIDKDSALYNPNWSPDFVDYLFLAFNTSTALSPTDAPVFSRWAKCLMMVQALTSLSILAVLAARAVNVL